MFIAPEEGSTFDTSFQPFKKKIFFQGNRNSSLCGLFGTMSSPCTMCSSKRKKR